MSCLRLDSESACGGSRKQNAFIVVFDALPGVFNAANRVLVHGRAQNFSEDCCVKTGPCLDSEFTPLGFKEGDKSNSLVEVCARCAGMLANVVHKVELDIGPGWVELTLQEPPKLKAIIRRRIAKLG